ncbi:DNA ligase D [Tahibacter harae]|uniref:DNA ligase (ATP) n=1 Tax=Tahibacter harae TaxID=2963937 RepID=A0ABT1QS38_9GAMM|nr:DNA ligase D [Tahibacter harae]MCQ4165072.1 DNA ligase D [Tahibacter harae]
MPLSEYKRKRNFRSTPEPAAGGEAGSHIFVVHLHHARRRHYDLRLEYAGSLKSWAVPKGPSFDPKVKRMAIQVEDHPISYAGFEGDIPEGNYGAGHVDIFDHGTWEAEGNVRQSLARGELKFTLHGNILRGSWVLVRTRRDAPKPQWLLIKHQDAYAGKSEADDFTADRGKPAARPRAAKSARKGTARAAAKKTNGAEGKREALDPGPFAPQLCRLETTAPAGDDWLHEAKWDGYRLLATVRAGKATLWSRNGLDWTARLPELAAALGTLGLTSAQFDGELVALNEGRDDFNDLQARLSLEKKNVPVALMLFDLPYCNGRSLREVPLLQRKHRLQQILEAHPHPLLRYSAHHIGAGPAVLAQAVRSGLEGIISKRVDSPYRGERNGDWIKLKSRASDEFIVIGYTPPKRSRIGLGALLLARPGADGLVYAGRVGTGFSDELLRNLLHKLQPLRRAEPVVDTSLLERRERDEAVWVRPELVIEVYHQGLGRQGLLRQPALKALREDKSPQELLSGKGDVVETSKSRSRAKTGTKATSAADVAAGADVRLTHPEREVFPGSGLTKQDVADYYSAVAPLLLQDIAGRPLSVLRCPDGAAGTCFFQKHAGRGWGDHVRPVAVREKQGVQAYIAVDDVTGLLQLVQMNVLEFHPWGALAQDQAHADRLVFDLDPHESVGWAKVKAAARTVREVLQGVGLTSFLRTSGGKGLHVVVPLSPPVGWAQAKRFAEDLADTLAAERPESFVSVASKQQREGRIFVDWLRNARGATSVASYSLRARAGAPVAMPLEWSELARLRSSDAYTLRNALRKIRSRRRDPWRELYDLEQTLPGPAARSRRGR